MLTQHIALVPEEDGLDPSEVARVSAALQKQVTRDLMPLWNIAATVDAFPALDDVPVGYWPIILTRCELGNHGRVHLDRSGQPYAQVQLRPLWSFAASRACLDMLVNPFELRSVTAPSLRSDQGPVDFLIEVCAPCEDPRNAYAIDGVLVSDFCSPAFFAGRTSQTERYTFRGMLITALRPQPGGHMTWYDPISDSYWLRNHWGDNPIDTKLGAVDRKVVSVRELVHACTPLRPMPELHARAALEGNEARARASQRRAQQLRALLGKRMDQELDAAIDAVRMDLPPVAVSVPVTVPMPMPMPMPAAVPVPAAAPASHIDLGEFEDIDTFVQFLDDIPELEEETTLPATAATAKPAATPPAAAPAAAPPPIAQVAAPELRVTPAPAPEAPAPQPAAPRAPSAAPALNTRDDAGRPPSSISPVSLGSLAERSDAKPKAPVVAALAAAAVLALVWTGLVTNAGSRTSKGSAQASRTAAATPPPPAAPALPTPAEAPAPAPAAAAPAAAQPAAARRVKPELPPVEGAPKAAPVRAAVMPNAKVKPAYELPLPPRVAPKMAAEPAATASIEDLIEDRR